MNSRTVPLGVFTVCLVFSLIGPASAGLLDTGSPLTSGTTAFDNGNNLSGTVDWAVFGPGDFPFAGYTPTAGELTYAYQVHSTGSDTISSYQVPVGNPADSIGSFSDPSNGVTGSAVSFDSLAVPGYATWQFSSGILTGASSEGLVYSSPNTPEEIFSILVDGGTYAIAVPVPTPSAEPIPEPGAILLLISGLAVVLLTGFGRGKRSKK